jgi:hypothetical protein
MVEINSISPMAHNWKNNKKESTPGPISYGQEDKVKK